MFYESLAFNEGGNDGFWRFQLRDKYGRWIKMGGSAMFEFRKPNDKNVYKAKGTFQGNIRRGASIIRVGEGEQLPPGDYEVDSRYIESIKAIINTTSAKPEIVDAPKSVNPDVEKQATEREMVAATVKDLEAGDIVQQSTEEALYGQINSVEHGDTESKINVTWSDGSNYDMTLPGEQKIKVWGVEPEPETVDAGNVEEAPEVPEATRVIDSYVAAAEVTAALAEKVGVLPTSIQAPREFKKHAARVILDKMLAAGTTVAQLIGATKSDGPLAVKFSGAPEESLDFESVVNKLPETADIVGQIRVDPDDILNPPYGDDTVMGAGSRLNIMKFNDSGNLEVSTIDVPNGFEMEGKTLKEIQTLAKEDPALRGFYGDFTLVGTSDSQRMFAESLSSRLVQNWAFTSNDSNLESLAIQDAAEELFGLGETASWSMGEDLENAVALDLKNHGDVYKAFLQAQYDATQEFFAEQGIKEFKLYRGFTSKSKVDTGYADTILRPLSAFSTKQKQAEEFALPGGFDYGYLVEMTVPVKDILGIPGLGFGCYEETEVVVLGGKKSAFIEML
jgi:hypothetical protein